MKLKPMLIAALFAAASAACATRPGISPAVEHDLVTRGDVQIETFSQGTGPVIVILPSLGRGAEDYDIVAAGLEVDGFRVLRPEPRGIGRSNGPMHDLDMHAFAADVASVLDHESGQPAGQRQVSDATY
jgi:pimeloyl-ACP methyl ester carboxylesterase